MISSGIKLVHAAYLKIDLLNHPKLQIFSKVQNTKFINDMEMICSVKVEDGVECQRISVKVDFVVCKRISIHQLEDVLMGPGLGQHAQPCERPLLQHPPHDLVLHTAQVDHHLGVVPLVPSNGGGVRGLDWVLTNERRGLGDGISINQ